MHGKGEIGLVFVNFFLFSNGKNIAQNIRLKIKQVVMIEDEFPLSLILSSSNIVLKSP